MTAEKPSAAAKPRLLFVDSANDLPSQLAEYYAKQLYGGVYDIYSAGPTKDIVDCDLISVMYCAGEDLRQQKSKLFNDPELPESYEYVIYLQKAVYDRWAVQEKVWAGKQILIDMGSRQDFKCTDDQELADCLLAMAAKIKAWVTDNLRDPQKLAALVTA